MKLTIITSLVAFSSALQSMDSPPNPQGWKRQLTLSFAGMGLSQEDEAKQPDSQGGGGAEAPLLTSVQTEDQRSFSQEEKAKQLEEIRSMLRVQGGQCAAQSKASSSQGSGTPPIGGLLRLNSEKYTRREVQVAVAKESPRTSGDSKGELLRRSVANREKAQATPSASAPEEQQPTKKLVQCVADCVKRHGVEAVADQLDESEQNQLATVIENNPGLQQVISCSPRPLSSSASPKKKMSPRLRQLIEHSRSRSAHSLNVTPSRASRSGSESPMGSRSARGFSTPQPERRVFTDSRDEEGSASSPSGSGILEKKGSKGALLAAALLRTASPFGNNERNQDKGQQE